MRNRARDVAEMASRKEKILETSFRVFAERSIEQVTMSDIAEACGIGVATLYRYYSTKIELAAAVGDWVWQNYDRRRVEQAANTEQETAAEEFERYLDAFLDLYQNHRDMLRYNQFFFYYAKSEHWGSGQLSAYSNVIGSVRERFCRTCEKGRRDGTLRLVLPDEELFALTLHLMMTMATRFAVGLAYKSEHGLDPEEEMRLLKRMLMNEFCTGLAA